MRVVIQRVSEASVTIDNSINSNIGPGLLILLGNGVCIFQQPVGQGAFAMVDMGYNAKIANILHERAGTGVESSVFRAAKVAFIAIC